MNVERLISSLILIGKEQAELLSLPPVDDSELRIKIYELLIERRSYECAMKGIITKNELANLILAHFQTFICNKAEVHEPSILPEYSGLVNKIIGLVNGQQ
jgi:hypothetical protein